MLISDKFILKEMVGSGGYGSVWKGIDVVTQEIVAIKVVWDLA